MKLSDSVAPFLEDRNGRVLSLESFDVLTPVSCLENGGLQRAPRKDQPYQLDPIASGMDMVCYYEVVPVFVVARKSVVAVYCALNLPVGIDAPESSGNHLTGIVIVLNQ